MEIICDSREKKDFFTFSSYPDVKVINKKLDTGDYSIVGFEDKITIDRKRNTNEIQMCFGQSWPRFYKELVRMTTFDEAYILCTFPFSYFDIFPKKSTIPLFRWKYLKMNGKYLKRRCMEIQEEFTNIKFIFAGCNQSAEFTAYNLLRDYYEWRHQD